MLLTSFHFSLVFRRSMTSENELSIVNRLVEYVIEKCCNAVPRAVSPCKSTFTTSLRLLGRMIFPD